MSSTSESGSSPVGTKPTPIGSPETTRKGLTVQNLGGGDLYIGGRDVTVNTGIRVQSGDSIPLGEFAGQLYGISAAGVLDVRWLGVS